MDILAYTQARNPSAIGFPAKDNVSAQNNSSVTGENLTVDQSQDAYSQATQAFRQLGHDVTEAPIREEAVSGDLDKVKAQYRSMMMASKHSADQYKHIPEPVKDGRSHIAGVSNLIDNIHSGYQKKYGEVVKASTQYMQDMNTAIGKMSEHIRAGSDGKVHFKPEAFMIAIDNIAKKYSGTNFSGSGSGSYFGNWNADLSKAKPLSTIKGSQQEFDFWNKKLSSQGFIVKYENGNINIFPDMKPIKEIFKSITESSASWDGSDIMAQELQSLQTAIDAQKNAINSSVSRLLETFRQDNSHFETLVQLLIQLIKDLNQNNNSLINM